MSRPARTSVPVAIPLSERLRTVAESLTAVKTPQEMAGLILRTATEALGATLGRVLVVDEAAERLQLLAEQGTEGADVVPWWHEVTDMAMDGSGPAADALRRQSALFFRHRGESRLATGQPDVGAARWGAVATAVLPMVMENRPLGALLLARPGECEFTPEETRFLRTLAAQGALALGRMVPSARAEPGSQLAPVGAEPGQLPGRDLAAAVARAEALAALGDALQGASTPQQAADLALRRIGPAIQAHGMLFVSLVGEALQLASVWGEVPDVILSLLGRPGATLRDTPTLRGVVGSGLPIYLDDYRLHHGALPSLPTQAVGIEPIRAPQGEVVGALVAMRPRSTGVWEAGNRDLLARAAATLGLALERAEAAAALERRTQETLVEARAQEAFVAFTELVGSETDVHTLTQQAVSVLQARFPGSSAAYYERDGTLWKARAWSDDVGEELLTVITAGLPETPLVREVLRRRESVFRDSWDAEREGVEHAGAYTSVASVPLILDGEVRGILALAQRGVQRWNERDRLLVRALGRSLTLALERADQAARLSEQNAELEARTQALEGFAALTRDLSVDADHLSLIRRAQEVVLSILPEGYALYFEAEGERWVKRAQTGDLRSEALQAVADAGLPYAEAGNLLRPYTTLKPYYQDQYARSTDNLDELVAHLGASATLPVLINGRPQGVFAVVLFGGTRRWSRPDQAALESVVRSLGLALERAEGLARLEARTQEVAQWRERYEVAVKGSGHLLYDWNPHTDEILYGGAVERITGYAADELAGTLDDWRGLLIHPDDREAFRAEIARVIDSGDEFHLAFRILRKDGSVAQVQDDGYFKRDEAGRVTRMVGFVKDVTERKLAQAMLLRTNEELRRSNAELEQFAYIASHDLQAPIRAVTSFSEILVSKYEGQLDERGVRYLRFISESGQHMKQLVDDLLTFSRLATQQRPPSPTDSGAVFGRVCRRLESEIQALDARVSAGDLPTVVVDGSQLDQLVQNLITNALKYHRPGVSPRIHVSARREGEYWRFAVADNGLGIEEKYFERIFVIFQRLHGQGSYPGTGIGLAVCKKIVERHGGRLWVESRLGEGSTFFFTLPAVEGRQDARREQGA